MFNPIYCSVCGSKIKPNGRYTVINGDVYCQEHADEWIKDELQEKFEKYRDQIMEIIGLPALEEIDG